MPGGGESHSISYTIQIAYAVQREKTCKYLMLMIRWWKTLLLTIYKPENDESFQYQNGSFENLHENCQTTLISAVS